jgi:RNA polymerase sigma-70 factor, ECF subfamily
MTEQSDAELVHECKNGNRMAFNQLVLRNQDRVYWTVRRMISDHDDALDITQEVFIRAYNKIEKFRGDSQFSTWLYSIATNLSINALRKKRLRTFLRIDDIQETLRSEDGEPGAELEQDEMRTLIDKAVTLLPEKQRLVFVLRYYEELPYEEISGISKTSVGGLKANYFHAVKKIEEYIKDAIR